MLVEDLTLQMLCYVSADFEASRVHPSKTQRRKKKQAEEKKLKGGFQFMIVISHQFIVFKNLQCS